MKTLKYFFALFFILLSTYSVNAAEISVSVDAYKYDLKPDFAGICLDSSDASIANLKTFSLSLIRYPSPKLSNYWDWKIGKINTNIKSLPKDLNKKTVQPFTLANLQKISQTTGTKPVFVLNMLNSSLNDQLNLLREANKLGIPIRYIELGSSFYLSTPEYIKKYPSIYSYLKEATLWKEAILKEFPLAEIAFTGTPSSPANNPRINNWNPIVSNGNILGLKAYGATSLFNNTYLADETQLDKKLINKIKLNTIDISTVLSNSIRAANKVSDDLANLPNLDSAWISEFNMFDNFGVLNGKWIQELYTGIMALSFVDNDKISKIIYSPKTTQPNANIIIKTIFSSMSGKTNYQRIIFDNAPLITDSRNDEVYFSLMGCAFSNQNNKEIILLNLASASTSIDTSMLLKDTTSTYIQYSASPLANASSAKKAKSKCPRILELPPYSITRIL